MNNTNTALLPKILLIAVLAVMMISVFLPFAKANEAFSRLLVEFSDMEMYEGTGITVEEMRGLSMDELLKIYQSRDIQGDMQSRTLGLITMWGMLLFLFIAIVFTILKKPAGVIISIIVSAIFALVYFLDYIKKDFSVNYEWSTAFYILIVGAILAIILAFCLNITKKPVVIEAEQSKEETEY